MCRIFYSPSSEMYWSPDELWDFFKKLESVGGGNGNGLYLLESKKLEKYAKYMPARRIVKEPIIFHTRKATHGKIADYNCQPFVGKRYVLAHNGVCSEAKTTSKTLGLRNASKYSDSYQMHYIIEKVGIMNFWLGFRSERFGVIIVYDKVMEKMFLLKSGSSNFTYAFIDGKAVYASSNLGFWILDNKKNPVSISDGLHRLTETGVETIEKYTKTVGYSYAYNNVNYGRGNYGGYWANGTWNRYGNNYKSNKNKKKKNTKIILHEQNCTNCLYYDGKTNIATQKGFCNLKKTYMYNLTKCAKGYVYVEEVANGKNDIDKVIDEAIKKEEAEAENIKGINAIFGIKKSDIVDEEKPIIPPECNGCTRIKNNKCFWQGTEQDFDFITDENGLARCNNEGKYIFEETKKIPCNRCSVSHGVKNIENQKYCSFCYDEVLEIRSDFNDGNHRCNYCGETFITGDEVWCDINDNTICKICVEYCNPDNAYDDEYYKIGSIRHKGYNK